MARIILEHKGQVLKDFPLHRESLTIGRRKDNTIVFNDPQVSAIHARIDKRGSDYILTDLQSTNGTFVNDLRVFSHRLNHGDRISVSKNNLLFIGTEKARIHAELDKIPLDRTVIVRGARQKKAQPISARSLPEPPIHQPKASGFLRRLLVVFFLVAAILGIGLWGFRDETPSFRGMISRDKSVDHGDLQIFPITKQELLPLETEPSETEDILEMSDLESGVAIDAIVWSSDGASSFALVDGTKVMVGQPINGMTVIEIGRDYVLLQPQDGQSTIRLTLTLK
jgi:pSer/pThr/pTyr-binding forkhead associated (FHA) protein